MEGCLNGISFIKDINVNIKLKKRYFPILMRTPESSWSPGSQNPCLTLPEMIRVQLEMRSEKTNVWDFLKARKRGERRRNLEQQNALAPSNVCLKPRQLQTWQTGRGGSTAPGKDGRPGSIFWVWSKEKKMRRKIRDWNESL
ncbi:hypothetical protein COCON_G00087070 [Conger conger]|uniref:Uncharacterized protein n=1 Tax=Conger conger TaxID=82655 RepID=A0A9Q1DK94_CONCO|nr:hypothetical protein COCON_G00087070 [Conger conger]